jgi:hypothetical protein
MEELSGLFENGSQTSQDSQENGKEDSIPDSWKALNNLAEGAQEMVHSSVGVNMFYSEFSDELCSGRGREELAREIYKHVNGDYDLSSWEDYSAEDVIDLQIYLLDELDNEGRLRGKDVVDYLERFIEQDGEPEYLEEF